MYVLMVRHFNWLFFCFVLQHKKSGVYDKAKETNNLKDEGKKLWKKSWKRRRPVKRLVEISEDVYKLKLPEQPNYNLDILFESILMHLIWRSGASEKKRGSETFSFQHESLWHYFPRLVLELENKLDVSFYIAVTRLIKLNKTI